MKSVYLVHFRSPKESLKNVFIASDEDTADGVLPTLAIERLHAEEGG